MRREQYRNIYIINTILVIICFIFIAYVLLMGANSSRVLIGTANRFIPDQAWNLESRDVYAPKIICLHERCDAAYYVWSTKHVVTGRELQELFDQNRLPYMTKGSCSDSPKYKCSFRGEYGGYVMAIDSMRKENNQQSSIIKLSVYKR